MIENKVDSSSKSAQRTSDPGGGGGGGPLRNGNGTENGTFEEEMKEEVAQRSLKKPYDVSVFVKEIDPVLF